MGRSTSRERERRSRSRSRERSRRSRSRSRDRRSRSRSRDRSSRDHGSRSDRYRESEHDRCRERESDRGRPREADRGYGSSAGASASGASGGYPQQRAAPAWQPAAPRFSDSRSYGGASAAPASYGHTPVTVVSSTQSSSGTSGSESFSKFQAALEQHNAARDATASKALTVNSGDAPGKAVALASLEELARKKLSDEAASTAQLKPVYLSKAQRQAAALAKLAERQVDAQATAAKHDAHMRQFLDAAQKERNEAREAAQRATRKAQEDRERKRAEDAQRRASGPGGGNPALSVHANDLTAARDLERARERELELIRNHYLGVKDPTQRKVHIPSSQKLLGTPHALSVSMSTVRCAVEVNRSLTGVLLACVCLGQKFKFNFDWNAKDDTGVDTNALYKHRHEAAAAYGRGFTGGVDRKEQRKKHSFYEQLVQHRLESGEVGGAEHLDAELLAGVKDEPLPLAHTERAAAAASASAAAAFERNEKALAREEREAKRARELELKNRHWTAKALAEMEERDWRIFKEDFSIATRGTRIPNPLRYWREAVLPPTLMKALEQAGYKDPTPIQRAAIPVGLQCRDVIGIAETGSGKCWGRGTQLLMYGGGSKAVEDIVRDFRAGVAQTLMGDDSGPRFVTSVVSGHTGAEAAAFVPSAAEPCAPATYEVTFPHDSGLQSWTCNGPHILVLRISQRPRMRAVEGGYVVETYALTEKHDGTKHPFLQCMGPFACAAAARESLSWVRRAWTPLEFTSTVEDFVQLPAETRAAAHMFMMPGVEFPKSQNADSLRERLADVMRQQGTLPEKDLPSDKLVENTAWVLGVWLARGDAFSATLAKDPLGDSCKQLPHLENRLDCWRAAVSGSPVSELSKELLIPDQQADALCAGKQLHSDDALHALLQSFNMLEHKHVPQTLLTESTSVRMHLLAGVLDGNASYDAQQHLYSIPLSQQEKDVKDGLSFLARSLGFRTNAAATEEGFFMRGADLHTIPVETAAKRALSPQHLPTSLRRDHSALTFDVRLVEHAEYFGVTLSAPAGTLHPRRCLLSDFVVTHNTCAFLVPMLVYISRQPQITVATAGEGPYALIMAPTRELAQQISEECDKFSKYMNIRNVCVVGGLSIEEQAFKLREGVEVIIGTPGRLFDCIQKRYLALNQCNYIVLDEADRMIDIGFEAQIQAVMDQMPSSNLRPEGEEGLMGEEEEAAALVQAQGIHMDDHSGSAGGNGPARIYRQTIMFSATMPPRVEALAKKYLRHAVFISVGDRTKAASRVEQRVEWLTSESQKKNRLLDLVAQSERPLIIFSNLKKTVDSICKWMSGINLGSVALHGGKSQDDRMAALAAFKAGEVPILVATDVAGRGLDVHGVKHVINYDMPDDLEKYTHRIGRTGRAGHSGLSTSFLLECDEPIFYDLKQMLIASNQPVPPQLAAHESSKFKPGTVSESGPPKPKIQYSSR